MHKILYPNFKYYRTIEIIMCSTFSAMLLRIIDLWKYRRVYWMTSSIEPVTFSLTLFVMMCILN